MDKTRQEISSGNLRAKPQSPLYKHEELITLQYISSNRICINHMPDQTNVSIVKIIKHQGASCNSRDNITNLKSTQGNMCQELEFQPRFSYCKCLRRVKRVCKDKTCFLKKW